MPTFETAVDLYYSQSLLGHFTIIAYDTTDLIAHRVHFVDKDAEASHSSLLKKLGHKMVQCTGFATGLVLTDWKASPAGFKEWLDYEKDDKTRVRVNHWNVTPQKMDDMLLWAHGLVQAQMRGYYPSYGYVIYSTTVDNCGSFALKCLAKAGIHFNLSALQSIIPFPSVIKDAVKTA